MFPSSVHDLVLFWSRDLISRRKSASPKRCNSGLAELEVKLPPSFFGLLVPQSPQAQKRDTVLAGLNDPEYQANTGLPLAWGQRGICLPHRRSLRESLLPCPGIKISGKLHPKFSQDYGLPRPFWMVSIVQSGEESLTNKVLNKVKREAELVTKKIVINTSWLQR